VLTVSDGVAAGERDDLSGELLAARLAASGFDPVERAVVPDEHDRIVVAMRELVATADVVLTTGGTGWAPRDVTPEAALDVIERRTPGVDEAMRGSSQPRHAMLSRAVSGIAGRCLVVTMPGSPRACEECYEAIAPALDHGLRLLLELPTAH
jgi:molybdenum cofactor synthesis domain-containing protein